MLISVIVVDAHNVIREEIARLLENTAEIAIVGVASSSETAISLAREKRPHVVIMRVGPDSGQKSSLQVTN